MIESAHGPLSNLELARLQIVQLKLEGLEGLVRAAMSAARVSAQTLAVARVGIWTLESDRSALRQLLVHSEGDVPPSSRDVLLPLARWPAYRDAILSRRVVATNDARTDPRTRELTAEYLDRHGVTAMLDAPLFLGGEVWGVVCHEHIGGVREWSEREIDFAVSVADMLSILLEQSMRVSAEKRQHEEETALLRAHQAEVLIRTASGIGHDVNTVLHAIALNAEQAMAAPPEARASAVASILNDCKRGARIVDQLRDLERPRDGFGVSTDLSFVVEDARPMLQALLGDRHSLTIEAAPALVPATRADLERILMNLVVNARDAMPQGGAIDVAVAVTSNAMTLTVRDRGVGIAPELVAQVFEPYFTTKGVGNKGLGLFAVHAIGSRTGADVTLSSTPGQGTAISVTWPRLRDTLA
jgi:two-component system cell cycle sensor histidine kinase/response regulator CckA